MNANETLFDFNNSYHPLADLLRPKKLDDVVGQQHLLEKQAPLKVMLESNAISSIILWGPPGCGKTTIARLLANTLDINFVSVTAIFSGVSDLKRIFNTAKKQLEIGKSTLLFVDEIHRFNRAQQDSFLPYVEDGTIILVGATTENPSFELNTALLSRCQVMVLHQLDNEALKTLLKRAELHMKKEIPLDKEATNLLIKLADGDGRYLLNLVEQVYLQNNVKKILTKADLLNITQKKAPVYDKNQESHYNLISALHKSMRGSDPNAALYWLARMLKGGEDPLYIARRLIRFANEDIGTADPGAVQQALAAWEVYERLGSPEGELAIAQAVVYLSTAPKSISVYCAFSSANNFVKKTGTYMPPKNILNAPTQLMKDLNYGKNYVYEPDTTLGVSIQNFFPEELEEQQFYKPSKNGEEKNIRERLDYWNEIRNNLKNTK